MLEFHFEWEEAPGVTSPALAATWARIEIVANGRTATRFWSTRSNSVRAAVYGSALPLARMIARHFWSLLHEELEAPELLLGARSGYGRHRDWFERHNLVLSREGMPYPDLTIYREDDQVGVRWVSDPEGATTPGRFIDEGFARLQPASAEASLSAAVEAVLERLEGVEDADVADLRADWNAVKSSMVDEAPVCSRLAAFGLDPYDADLDPRLVEALEGELLSEPLLRDLLPATDPAQLAADVAGVRRLIQELPPLTEHAAGTAPGSDVPYSPLPFRAGYLRADALRQRLGLDPTRPLDDLDAVACTALGATSSAWLDGAPSRNVEVIVQQNGVCAMAASARPPEGQRFLHARALHHWLFSLSAAAPCRLLTRANGWQQVASRAFAAELLAPAAALASRLGRDDGADFEDELAREFKVSRKVIFHQLENHRLR